MKTASDLGRRPPPEKDRWSLSRMRRGRTVAHIGCVLLGLALPVWNSGQNSLSQESAPAGSLKAPTNLQIQSSVLRVEFDHNLRSRVVVLLVEARNC